MIRPKKVRITQEILEMTRRGLINFRYDPSSDHRARIKGKKYEQNFIKILKVNHHKTVDKNLNKDTIKSNMPTSEIPQIRSVDSSKNNQPLKCLIHNPGDGTIKTMLHTSDYVMTEKVINNEVFKVNTPRRRMHRRKKENYQKQMDWIIEGYAQAIRKLRKERNQSTENSSQKTGDNEPELEETPEVNYNKNQENTRHLGNKDNGEKKTKGHKVAEDLVTTKWKSRMIVLSLIHI